uniref:HAT C-terminal dimerisation domain-containing protein n=1 Tax=Fusarium oxysporum (strain Fo5176) TaxID=660025 RepID=A0A0D2XSP0_FUSOF
MASLSNRSISSNPKATIKIASSHIVRLHVKIKSLTYSKHHTPSDRESSIAATIETASEIPDRQSLTSVEPSTSTTPKRKRITTADATWQHTRKPQGSESERAGPKQDLVFYCKYCKFFSPFEANSRHMPARYDSSDDEAVKGDEYETWQGSREASDRRVRDPITYWHERRLKYPRLSRMALDFLTIQPMSAECERLFSAAGRMAVPSRSLLDAQIISICQVSRSWYRAGIVKELDPMLISWREEEQIYEGLGMSDGELAEQATAWLRAQGDEGESEG